MPVLPLLFICFSQNRPPRVSNPVRYNRRNLSQPYFPLTESSVRCSEAIFHLCRSIPLSSCRWLRAPAGMFSVKRLQNVLSSSLRFFLVSLNYGKDSTKIPEMSMPWNLIPKSGRACISLQYGIILILCFLMPVNRRILK